MTNDRNMGNIETANQSNLVSAHGIFNNIKSTNIYVYTPYHAVSADTIRRYHTGLVRQTNQKASQIVEKYCRTVYKSIG